MKDLEKVKPKGQKDWEEAKVRKRNTSRIILLFLDLVTGELVAPFTKIRDTERGKEL